MAGILDSKTRFIDFVITREGKRQIASGKMRAEYASVSDVNTFYGKNDHDNVDDRIYFEVMHNRSNSIVIEKDDSGRIIDFDFSPTGSIVGNDIFDKDNAVTSSLKLSPVTGSNFASTSTSLFNSFLNHFKANMLTGTSFDNGSNEFELNRETINFAISNSVPWPNGPSGETINVNNAEPFFFDSKLTHLDNFSFLPPVNTDGTQYGSYTDLRSRKREEWDDIKNALGNSAFIETGLVSDDTYSAKIDKMGDFSIINRENLTNIESLNVKQHQTINFRKTSLENNLLIQMFEDSSGSKLTKLDIIDAGAFTDNEDLSGRYEKHVFYVGKIYFDDFNVPTFINIFTLVFD